MRWVVTFLSLIGCALSGYALLVASAQCTSGQCPTGATIPLLGITYFALIFWLAILRFPTYRLRLLSLVAAMVSIGLLLAMIWQQRRCTSCFLVHLTNFALLLSILPTRRPRAVRPDPVKPLVALALALLTTATFATIHHWRRTHPASLISVADGATLFNQYMQSPLHRELLDSNGHTLIMFTDLTCDICQKVDEMLHDRTLPAWDGKVRLIYKHYPICTDCNPTLPRNSHPAACDAAYLAEAARVLRGEAGFEAVKSAIPAGLDRVTPTLITSVAAELRIGATDLQRAMLSSQVKDAIAKDIRQADDLKVDGTPTLYLDGREIGWTALGDDRFISAWAERNP